MYIFFETDPLTVDIDIQNDQVVYSIFVFVSVCVQFVQNFGGVPSTWE